MPKNFQIFIRNILCVDAFTLYETILVYPVCFIGSDNENQKVEGEFIRDGSYVRNPCMVAVDTNAGNVYIAEHSDRAFGMVYLYTSFGQFITSFSTNAPRPVDAVFVTGN